MCPIPFAPEDYICGNFLPCLGDAEPSIIVKIEDSPEPEFMADVLESSPQSSTSIAQETPTIAPRQNVIDPKDPEGFLRRCSGYNKKTKLRCSQSIGRNSSNAINNHSTYLPTCKTHQDQKSFAGWCQYMHPEGERCGRLFRWTPPYFELCEEHQGHPNTPCYLLKLPLELRHEIFRYLLPSGPIGSSTFQGHQDPNSIPFHPYHRPGLNGMGRGPVNQFIPPHPRHHPAGRRSNQRTYRSMAPSRSMGPPLPPGDEDNTPTTRNSLMNLMLVNPQFKEEVKDLTFSILTFTIDIRRDGTYMCGRRVLEPTRPDGSLHTPTGNAQQMGKQFIKSFDFKAVKNYDVNILVEDWSYTGHDQWDEEVEIYDIRDYIGVTVTGILGLARNLCKLNVRIGLSGFNKWSDENLLTNLQSLTNPFERLRNVRQPRLHGVFDGFRERNFMATMQVASSQGSFKDLCSVPILKTDHLLLGSNNRAFDIYRRKWEKCIEQTASSSLCQKSPIRGMFTEFKHFYTKLTLFVPDVTYRQGRHAFLHRARVARECEDVEALRHLRNELIQYWYLYLEKEEEKKTEMNKHLCSMLESDIYPSHEPETTVSRRGSASGSSPKSPIVLDAEKMVAEGIPMVQNPQEAVQPYQLSLQMLQRQQQAQYAVHIRREQELQIQALLATQQGKSIRRVGNVGNPSDSDRECEERNQKHELLKANQQSLYLAAAQQEAQYAAMYQAREQQIHQQQMGVNPGNAPSSLSPTEQQRIRLDRVVAQQQHLQQHQQALQQQQQLVRHQVAQYDQAIPIKTKSEEEAAAIAQEQSPFIQGADTRSLAFFDDEEAISASSSSNSKRKQPTHEPSVDTQTLNPVTHTPSNLKRILDNFDDDTSEQDSRRTKRQNIGNTDSSLQSSLDQYDTFNFREEDLSYCVRPNDSEYEMIVFSAGNYEGKGKGRAADACFVG